MLEQSGQIKGLALIFWEFPIGRSIVEVMTTPELAGNPGEIDLVQQSVAKAESQQLSVAHICVMANSEMGKVLEQAGFTNVRAYLDMLWIMDELAELELLKGYSVRSFQTGDTPLLTQVQNDAFTGNWGFCPNTEEQIEYRTQMPNTSKDGILFLIEGNIPAGYCWTMMVPAGNGVRGVIGMIAVVPDYRGKGVSRHILQAEIKHLRSIGLAEIGLDVDGNNAPAVGLYKSTGFKTMGERHWFERVLPGT